jgi:hypothetical protein
VFPIIVVPHFYDQTVVPDDAWHMPIMPESLFPCTLIYILPFVVEGGDKPISTDYVAEWRIHQVISLW